MPSGLGVSNQMTAVGYPMPCSSAALPNTTVSGALKQRVFTGVVTKLMDNFGFVDEDVFFQLRYNFKILFSFISAPLQKIYK